jgi:8-oxo-dGTP diphosphatase
MNRNEEAIFTNMCMIYDGDYILVQDRCSADWPGVTFPGGHVEHGESFVESVKREVFEETDSLLRILLYAE